MQTVVAVEDNQSLREIFRLALSRTGYAVLTAPDGASALALAEGIDSEGIVLLTDLIFPEMNGLELAAEFIRRHPTSRVGMMSGATPSSELAGPDMLLKPFSMVELVDFVAELCYPTTHKKPQGVVTHADGELEQLSISEEVISDVCRLIREQLDTVQGDSRELEKAHRMRKMTDKDFASSLKSLRLATIELVELRDSLPRKERETELRFGMSRISFPTF
jgi:DNA-binding response OmpR family regulator